MSTREENRQETRRKNRITQELITANCAEKTTEIFSQSTCPSKSSDSISWGLIIAYGKEGEQKLDIRLGTSKSILTVLRERGREKGVCTTMTTKWQLIETWIINATPHSKMLPQGQLQPPIVRLPLPRPLPFLLPLPIVHLLLLAALKDDQVSCRGCWRTDWVTDGLSRVIKLH